MSDMSSATQWYMEISAEQNKPCAPETQSNSRPDSHEGELGAILI